MASLLLTTLLVLACACVVLGAPKKDSYGGSAKKAASSTTKPPRPKCDECPDDYTPVCGKEKDSKEKPKSFGNICVMNKYNCEHGTNLVKESDGECKDGSGVRLA